MRLYSVNTTFNTQNAGGHGRRLGVQSDLLSGLNTRVVVPLLERARVPTPAQRPNPVLSVDGAEVGIATPSMAAIPEGERKHVVGPLGDEQPEASTALDRLFLGL